MKRECQVRICGSLGGKFPGATRRRSLRLGNRDESRIADLTATGLEALGAEV
jgi:hypothetical protein